MCIQSGMRRLLPTLLLFVVTAGAQALPADGWRVGIQAGGTGLASIVVEYRFSDNAVMLSVGIFDSFNEPDVALWYRRYVRIAPVDSWGFVPYGGVGAAGLLNVSQPANFIAMVAASLGANWNFWSNLSLSVEGDLLLGVWPQPVHVGFIPALALWAGF